LPENKKAAGWLPREVLTKMTEGKYTKGRTKKQAKSTEWRFKESPMRLHDENRDR